MYKLIFIAVFFLTINVFGCTCRVDEDFLETLNRKNKKELISGEIIGIDNNLYQIKINTVIKGKLVPNTILTLENGNGGNCLPVFFESDVGKSYLLILNKSLNQTKNQYELTTCGTNMLRMFNSKIKGRISGGRGQSQEMLLSDFLDIYHKKDSSREFKIFDLTTNETYKLNGVGQRIGNWKIVGYNKLIIEKGVYNSDGIKTGEWIYYLIKQPLINGIRYPNETAIKKIVVYNSGKLIQILHYFDKNGKALYWGTLYDGNGELFEYDDLGKLYGKYSYKNGIREGNAIEYLGDRIIKGKYKNGKREGVWITYENDIWIRKEVYLNGIRIK
ncbi:hypothetical protein [uncultured Aquimarina sp.]|uniref:toxin-antitoxin system YwqK family antitoxin n=1 Tax=uncultured Aquimarina sp. TaxID=575652 RepID=UPI002625F783|nr:hypothetical protein [uncultured Aquimarina sp.]